MGGGHFVNTTTFSYNYLNLPQSASKTGTSVTYLYDAVETKLQKKSTVGTVNESRDYIEGIEYKGADIDIIHNSTGYALKSGTNYVYHYNLIDHLGNVRATLKRGSTATSVDVTQRENYYPFGKQKVVAGGNNKYLYNGKEIQGELGGQYDYGARFYDAEVGRWNVIDPMAEMHYDNGMYSYVLNNPLTYSDLLGLDTVNNNNNFAAGQFGKFNTAKDVVALNEVTVTRNSNKSSGNFVSNAVQSLKNSGSDHPYFGSRPYDAVQYRQQINASRDPAVDLMNFASGFGEGYVLARGGIMLIKGGIPLIMRRWALRSAFRSGSNVLLYTARQLQAKFKHAADFGVIGNYSKANASKFSSALNQHINASGTQIIQGTYRNANNPVTFYLNPQTGLNVMASPSGHFISGAALSPAQIQGILTKGFLW